MKIAIVGSSRLDEVEYEKAEKEVYKIINAHEGCEIITGDAKGIDELVCSFHGYASNILDGMSDENARVKESEVQIDEAGKPKNPMSHAAMLL